MTTISKIALPDNWQVSNGLREWTKRYYGWTDERIDTQETAFRNHFTYTGKPQSHWGKTWKAWVKRRAGYDRRSNNPRKGSP